MAELAGSHWLDLCAPAFAHRWRVSPISGGVIEHDRSIW